MVTLKEQWEDFVGKISFEESALYVIMNWPDLIPDDIKKEAYVLMDAGEAFDARFELLMAKHEVEFS